MSTRQLNENEMSVIRALVRDVVSTIALKDEVAFTDWLVGVAAEARRRTWAGDSLQAFEDYVVGDVQQWFHDEFIDGRTAWSLWSMTRVATFYPPG